MPASLCSHHTGQTTQETTCKHTHNITIVFLCKENYQLTGWWCGSSVTWWLCSGRFTSVPWWVGSGCLTSVARWKDIRGRSRVVGWIGSGCLTSVAWWDNIRGRSRVVWRVGSGCLTSVARWMCRGCLTSVPRWEEGGFNSRWRADCGDLYVRLRGVAA